jgi:hypothetical protein
MPIREWAELVEGTPVEIHASPDSAAPRGNAQATLEMYRAAASNYHSQGAHGFYFFNMHCRYEPKLVDVDLHVKYDFCGRDHTSDC